MKTQWKIVALDETMYWSEQIVARAGRLYGIYLFDANRHVYCCDTSPSYELYPVDLVTTKPMEDDSFRCDIDHEWLMATDAVSYHYVRNLDRLDAKWFEAFPKFDEECATDEEWETQLEEMQEYLRGNGHCPPGVPFEVEA
jgi:hypothetical protein